MRRRFLAHLRSKLVRGLLLILPLLITVWLLGLLFDIVNRNVTPWVRRIVLRLGTEELEGLLARGGIPVMSLILTVGLIYLVGLLASNLAGRRIGRAFELVILRIPLVKSVYGSARQLLDAFSMGGQRTFSKVVMLEYPRHGLWTVGFLTTEAEHQLPTPGSSRGGISVPVFLPTTPNPTSGWMVLVPTADLRQLDMTVEEGIKLVVSGGIVGPSDLGTRVREWDAGG